MADILSRPQCHTMDLLWEKFQWILPLYMKPISFQSKASVVCSVTAAIFIDFCLKKLNVFSQHIGKNTNWYLNSAEKNVKSVYGTNVSTQALSAPISSLSLLLVQTQAAKWKAATPEQLTGAHLYLDITESGYLFHAVGNVMMLTGCGKGGYQMAYKLMIQCNVYLV